MTIKKALPLLLSVLLAPLSALAGGKEDFSALKQCVMSSDEEYCHHILTPASHELLDKFLSYKLMPCLPTDFTYHGEQHTGDWTIIKATQPAAGDRVNVLRLAFTRDKLDLPESLRIGLGENWQNKLNMAEQLFLLIRANAGGNFRCDQLTNVVRK